MSPAGGTMTTTRACEACKGRGWIELRCTKPDEAVACGLCNGTGVMSGGKDCSGCRGTGRIEVRTVEQQKCLACLGTGLFPVPESM